MGNYWINCSGLYLMKIHYKYYNKWNTIKHWFLRISGVFVLFQNKFKGINVVFRTNNSLSKYIENNKSKTEKGQKSSIYELKCGSCEKVYIGQTGRTFDERMGKNFHSYRLNYRKSNYANNTADFDHIFVNDFKILHIEEKGKKMNVLESLEINKQKFDNILLNDQTDINSSPLLNVY